LLHITVAGLCASSKTCWIGGRTLLPHTLLANL
jgi:hypothetical protein